MLIDVLLCAIAANSCYVYYALLVVYTKSYVLNLFMVASDQILII